MKIHLHIERMVVDGLPLTARDGALLRAALEAELTRLLAQPQPDGARPTSLAVPRVRADGIRIAQAAKPAEVGQQIARSVHGAIGRAR